MDAPKVFDKINQWSLFHRLIDRKTPTVIVKILHFWYGIQRIYIKWGTCISDSLKSCNGVRQGGILSPKLFSVYIDDLSANPIYSMVGYHIYDNCINHVMYVEDICRVASSSVEVQILIDICYKYSLHNDVSFNYSKSYCVVFKPKLYKSSFPELLMGTKHSNYVDDKNYLK